MAQIDLGPVPQTLTPQDLRNLLEMLGHENFLAYSTQAYIDAALRTGAHFAVCRACHQTLTWQNLDVCRRPK